MEQKDRETIESIRDFALLHNEVPFAHLCVAALEGEEWAKDRIKHFQDEWWPVYCATEIKFVVRAMQETNIARPYGVVAKNFTDSLTNRLPREARSCSEETEAMESALQTAGREYGKHSGPQSNERERSTFARDLRTAALRYARAYYAEARELGLVPAYERTDAINARAKLVR